MVRRAQVSAAAAAVTLSAMRRACARVGAVAAVALLSTAALSCSRPAEQALPVPEVPFDASPAAQKFAAELRQRVTVAGMTAHLRALQGIADTHGGNRAAGTPGYDASVDYVAGVLRGKGFEVATPEFEVRVFTAEKPALTVGGAQVEADALKYTAATPAEGVRGPLVPAPAEESPGCVPADYDGVAVKGAVVLVDRGGCPFHAKQEVAATLGAVALVVADNVDEDFMPGTLGEDTDVRIPVVSVSKTDGARLRAAPGPVTLTVDASTRDIKSRNVIAQTKTGSAADVVMAGGHLDSVQEGPGINDNGSGVAALLETAVQLGSSPPVRNAVRFAFWGAEEVGLTGSQKYVQTLDIESLRDIALYLNFDMIGSPNAGYFTLDGDQSTAPGRGEAVPRVPEGSAGIERTFVGYLRAQGKPAQDTFFDGRSDYDAFTTAGIPAGGLFAGAEEKKTAEQAKLWGGTADEPFDPDYHKGTDTVDRINAEALGIQGGGVGFVIGRYAQDLRGRNGIPVREDRTRHLLPES